MSQRLGYIDFFRAICVIIIVAFHCYGMMYAGHFPSFVHGYKEMYFTLFQCILVTFAMPMFTVISGLLYGRLYNKGKYRDRITFIKGKARHLILPFLLFTALFIPLSAFNSISVSDSIFQILRAWSKGGYSHLWYLPMIFWCFFFTMFINKKSKYIKIGLLVIAFAFSLFSYDNIGFNVFGLFSFLSWYFFFLFGYFIGFYHKQILNFIDHNNLLVLIIVICIFSGWLSNFPKYGERNIYYMFYISSLILIIIYSCEKFINTNSFLWNNTLIKTISKYSYGIYIFHYLLAPFLISGTVQRLFHIDRLAADNIILFPLSFTILTFIISLTITWLFQKTMLGKYLLG